MIILLFAAIAFIIFLATGKGMAVMASIGLFIAYGIEISGFSFERTIISLAVINLAMCTLAALEYKHHGTPLSRSLMWLYSITLAVVASYMWVITEIQTHIMIGITIMELILLATMDGCRNVGDVLRSSAGSLLRWRPHFSRNHGGKG